MRKGFAVWDVSLPHLFEEVGPVDDDEDEDGEEAERPAAQHDLRHQRPYPSLWSVVGTHSVVLV